MRDRLLLLVVVAVAPFGCRCVPLVTPIEVAPLVVSPARLTFPPTFLQRSARLAVELTNSNTVEQAVTLAIEGPFTVEAVHVVAPGETLALAVTFRPVQAGVAEGKLSIGALEVVLEGEGLASPPCVAADQCHHAFFDDELGQCVMAPEADGTSCATACLPTGSCQAGACIGSTTVCDDQNACTVDACDEQAGCRHLRRSCPRPMDRCKRAECDPSSGCGEVDAPDGTLCGPDDCAATTVEVCLAGQCTTRNRPTSARCQNTWLPITVPTHHDGSLLGFDDATGTVLLVHSDGLETQTWRWNGVVWELLLPLTPLPAHQYSAMAADPISGRLVVVGKGDLGVEHWEWDGFNWNQRFSLALPTTCDAWYALTTEPASGRLLLSCLAAEHHVLWAWDGNGWRSEGNAPWTAMPRFLGDGMNGPLLAFTRTGGISSTFEWTPSGFLRRERVGTPPGYGSGGTDPLTHEPLWFERLEPGVQVWRWRSGRWLDEGVLPAGPSEHCASALDRRRGRLVLSGGFSGSGPSATTWEWTGQQLLERASPPPMLWSFALTSGPAPLLLGTSGTTPLSFRFDGRQWQPGPLPPLDAGSVSAWAGGFDSARSMYVVSVSEQVGAPWNTWEFDGGTWRLAEERSPVPAHFGMGVGSAPSLGVVAFGGGASSLSPSGFLFVWDGARWRSTGERSGRDGWNPSVTTDVTGLPFIVANGLGGVLEVSRWNDGGWDLLPAPTLSPMGDLPVAATFDPARQRTLLLALPVDPAQGGPRTLEWDGATWTQRSPTRSPSRMSWSGSMAFDAASQRVLFVTGTQTWAFFP